jgi:hypothetical protein
MGCVSTDSVHSKHSQGYSEYSRRAGRFRVDGAPLPFEYSRTCLRFFVRFLAVAVPAATATAPSGPAAVGVATVPFRSAFTASKPSAPTCSQATLRSIGHADSVNARQATEFRVGTRMRPRRRELSYSSPDALALAPANVHLNQPHDHPAKAIAIGPQVKCGTGTGRKRVCETGMGRNWECGTGSGCKWECGIGSGRAVSGNAALGWAVSGNAELGQP